MAKASKNKRHGRRVHRPSGSCAYGKQYSSKREAERIGGEAKFCKRCRHFHVT